MRMIDQDPWGRLARDGIAAMLIGPSMTGSYKQALHVIRNVPSSVMQGVGGELSARPAASMVLAPAQWVDFNPATGNPAPFMEERMPGLLGHNSDLIAVIRAFVDLGASLGIVPSIIPDQRGELAAVRDHLADMRRLALGALLTDGPETSR